MTERVCLQSAGCHTTSTDNVFYIFSDVVLPLLTTFICSFCHRQFYLPPWLVEAGEANSEKIIFVVVMCNVCIYIWPEEETAFHTV